MFADVAFVSFKVQAGTRLGLGKPRGTSQVLPPGKNENIRKYYMTYYPLL